MARRTEGDRTIRVGRTAAATRVGMLALLLALLLVSAPLALARPAGPGGAAAAVTKPKVTKQPSSATVLEGQSASFTAEASGATSTQWQVSKNSGSTWQSIEGATADTYTIAHTSLAENGEELRCVFSNAGGETITKEVTLTVQSAPVVMLEPSNATAAEGGTATFESTASGSPTPTVQWQSQIGAGSWKNISGATSTVLTLKGVKNSQSGTEVRAVFRNAAGEATSQPAKLTVQTPPKITLQPKSQTVSEGTAATFEATASGFPEPEVQWEVSSDNGSIWTALSGQTHKQLAIADAEGSESGNEYRATFTNVAGSSTSEAATLTVQGRPTVTTNPRSAMILAGGTASFEAAAKGTPAPSVSWEVTSNSGASWSTVPGASRDQLTLEGVPLSDNGEEYRATFTNSLGTASSSPALLTVAASDNTAYGWGLNTHGQVGIGSTEPYIDSPTPIEGLQFVTAMAGGAHHSLALLANGTVESWGFNGYGQLGDAGAIGTRSPILVEGLSHVTSIAAGGNHSLALLANGTMMAWGDNESGQLGDGKTANSEVPVAIGGLSEVVAISAGEEDSMALLANGTVMVWGNGENGQLGNGKVVSHDTPQLVKGLSGVKAVAAGGRFDMALLADGTVMAWGDDNDDELGNATVLDSGGEEETEEEEELGYHSDVPVPVEGLSGVTAIAAGRTHAIALLQDGSVMTWGNDSEGELGNGEVEPASDTPAAVSGLSGVTAVSAGDQESIALLSSGGLMAWGSNSTAALGDGTRGEPSDVPVAVNGIAGAAGVSAGGSHMLAFGESLPSVVSISPASGPTSGGTAVTITGTALSSASAVHFGSSPAASFEVESDTRIRAISPAGTGTVNVTVTTSSGTTPTSSADRFAYEPAPTVTKLSSKGGPASGGTAVTITGTGFSGVTAVHFGAVEATQYTVVSPTSITVVAPANAAGVVDVTVTATGGTSAKTGKDHYKYAPVIESISPPEGPTAGGTVLTVTGAGFALGKATKFKFGKAAAKVVDCTSETSCTVTAPAAKAPGTVSVTATAGKATSAAASGAQFTYE